MSIGGKWNLANSISSEFTEFKEYSSFHTYSLQQVVNFMLYMPALSKEVKRVNNKVGIETVFRSDKN